ncbi:MAG: exonuclease domain-containing protein [Bacilli bacterium]|nr:exonuclease domain-containing protein [Bacilli bacterium]
MKDLAKHIGDRRTLLFFDLEATQISHEAIEIGAYRVSLNDDYSIRKVFRPYQAYIKPKHRIGQLVTKLTGITEDTIAKKGISYREMLNGVRKYLGKEFGKTLFVCYGDQDPRILQASSENNMDADRETSRFMSRHCFDFLAFLGQYIRDDHNNPLSLTHMCERFSIQFEGKAHGALADAKNLLSLYEAFLTKKDVVKESYKRLLSATGSVPPPVKKILNRLSEGKTVTPEDFDRMVEESLK